jgi:DNA-binding transcriptional ArsR family regulator
MNESASRPADRRIDMESLKALAHPLRVQILDVLSTYGAHTASGLAERLGESSGATSYHLRQLERHAFVREVEGRGTARERWWERVPGGIALDHASLPPTAAARAAHDLVLRQWQRTRETLLDDFLAHGDDVLPKRWLEASMVSTANARLTSDQLKALTEELQEVVDRHVDRYRHQKDSPIPGARPVQIQLNGFPVLDAEETPGTPDTDTSNPEGRES